jgi:hypothetical protein
MPISDYYHQNNVMYTDYVPPEFEYYVLKRNKDYVVKTVMIENNPLYGMGSWDIYAGPFTTMEEAEWKMANL